MKILIVHNFYQHHGGERVSFEAQVSLLHEYGHDVRLYTRHNEEIRGYTWWQKATFFLNTLFSVRAYRELKQTIVDEQPDVAHVHNVFPLISPAVYWVLKNSGVPIIQTLYNFRFICPNGLLYTHGEICERCKYANTLHAIHLKCYRNSYILSAFYAFTIGFHRKLGTFNLIDRFVAPAGFTAKKIIESGLTTSEKITVLNYFLSRPLPKPGSFKYREPYVVYLGRLSPEKGMWTLLKAMVGLPGLHLKVLGSGPLAVQAKQYIEEHQLQNVELVGFVSGETKWRLLREALASVVPSEWYENSPFAALESLAVGTPVVASDIGSMPDIVEDEKNGLLFRPGDSQDLQDKLQWLVTHSKEAMSMGHYGRHVIETQYSAETHYRRLITIYASVKQ